MEARAAAPKSKRSPMNSDKNLTNKKTQKKKKNKLKRNNGGKDPGSEKTGSANNASPDTEETPVQAGEGGDSEAETVSTIPLQVLHPTGPASSPPAPVSVPHHEPKPQKPKPQTGAGVASYRPPVRMAFSNNTNNNVKRTDSNNNVKRTDSKRLNGKNNAAQRQQRTVRMAADQFNESLRWEYALENEEDEEERLMIYKQNRRKRYLAAQNAAFPQVDNSSGGTGSSASSMSLSPSPSGDVTSLPSMMTSQLETPRSARLDDIHLDAVGCI